MKIGDLLPTHQPPYKRGDQGRPEGRRERSEELDEYVVTKQLTEYFVASSMPTWQRPTIRTTRCSLRSGVWVSGFFSSGQQSHFIKILSHLLENLRSHQPRHRGEETPPAADEHKIKDSMLLADIQRAGARRGRRGALQHRRQRPTAGRARDVILQVFLRVFNEKLGFSADAPQYRPNGALPGGQRARMTPSVRVRRKQRATLGGRARRRRLPPATTSYSAASRSNSLSESAGQWFDHRATVPINIESFAKLVNACLETRPTTASSSWSTEVGQFIGDNTKRCSTCRPSPSSSAPLCRVGRGSSSPARKTSTPRSARPTRPVARLLQDPGPLPHRLSLASSNTDEVIGERLLAKREGAHDAPCAHLRSPATSSTISSPSSATRSRCAATRTPPVRQRLIPTPLPVLLQKIFPSPSAGRRHRQAPCRAASALAARRLPVRHRAQHGSRDVGLLIPLYDFYPSIESFIDTVAKRSIDEGPTTARSKPSTCCCSRPCSSSATSPTSSNPMSTTSPRSVSIA